MPAIDPIADNESGFDARTKINAAISEVNGLGDAATKNVGTAAGTVAAGDDARFTDARTPTTHAASHKHGGNDEVATSTPAANAIPKAGADNKLAAGWLPIGTAANTVAAGDDARFTDARTPTSHADSHVTGGDDKIRDATASQDGLMTAAHATKLDSIAANADVTEDAIDDAAAVTSIADTDKIPLVSAATLKNIAYSALKTLLNAIYALKGAVTTSGLTMSTGKLLGRGSAESGAIEEIGLGAGFSITGGNLTFSGGGGGVTLLAFNADGTSKTTAYSFPFDDTKPQNTEGEAYSELDTTVSVTTGDELIIAVNLKASSAGINTIVGALFKDSDADCLESGAKTNAGASYANEVNIVTKWTAPSTGSVTFKVRFGVLTSGTVYLNTAGGTAYFGGTLRSSIAIWKKQ